MSTRLVRLLAPLLAVGLLLGACGDDGGGSSDAASTDSEQSDGDQNGGGVLDVSGSCRAASGALAELAGAFAAALSPDADDPADLANAFSATAAEAPEEIKNAFGVLADAYQDFSDELASAGVDLSDPSSLVDQDAAEALAGAGAAFESDEITEATDDISDWVGSNCEGVVTD
jgi:hypothetical protein